MRLRNDFLHFSASKVKLRFKNEKKGIGSLPEPVPAQAGTGTDKFFTCFDLKGQGPIYNLQRSNSIGYEVTRSGKVYMTLPYFGGLRLASQQAAK